MSLNIVRVYGDEAGETHFGQIAMPAESGPGGVGSVAIPSTRVMYLEYPEDRAEVTPGFHAMTHLVICLRGGFEVTTTTGDSRKIGPGDWFFSDDLGSKGHVTKAVGSVRRVNLVIGLPDGWQFPGT